MSSSLKKLKRTIALKRKIKFLGKKIFFKYESAGLFISFKLLKIGKKKVVITKPIQFLRTAGYVIPLPREEEKKKKKKIKFVIGQKFYQLYDHYDRILRESRGVFDYSDYNVYNPTTIQGLPLYDHNLKFDIMRILQNFFGLYMEKSFTINYLKGYFYYKRLKSLTLVYFRDLFGKYGSPNLPLLRGKGSGYMPKEEGTALLTVREIIYGELVFEELGLEYHFSDYERRVFKKVYINPFDRRFDWSIGGLHILDLCSEDGRIVVGASVPEKGMITERFRDDFFLNNAKGSIQLVNRSGGVRIFYKRKGILILTILLVQQFNYWKILIIQLVSMLLSLGCNIGQRLEFFNINRFYLKFSASFINFFNRRGLLFYNNFMYKLRFRVIPDIFFGLKGGFRYRFYKYFGSLEFLTLKINNVMKNNFIILLQIYLSINVDYKNFTLQGIFELLYNFECKASDESIFLKKISKGCYFIEDFFYFLLIKRLTFGVFSKFFLRPIRNFYINQHLPVFRANKIKPFKISYTYLMCLFQLFDSLNLLIDLDISSKIAYQKLIRIAGRNLKLVKVVYRGEFKVLGNIFKGIINLKVFGLITNFELVALYNYCTLFFLFKKFETIKISGVMKGIIVYDLKKGVLRIFGFLKIKGWNASVFLFFRKLYIGNSFNVPTPYPLVFWVKKNYNFSFSLSRYALKFGIELPSMNYFKITLYDDEFNKVSCREKTLGKGLYEYFKTDYCLTRGDYYVPLPLTVAQKRGVEEFGKYFENRDLKRNMNYFVLDNMMLLLRFTFFFGYFSCISPLLNNNLYLAFNNNLLVELGGQGLNYHKLQLVLDESRYYNYLRVYFKIKYYFPSNIFKFGVKLKKKVKKKC